MIKLIDDKGRIFGRVNVIDFIIVFTVLIVIPAFYLGQKFMREFYSGVELYDRDGYSLYYSVAKKCPNCGRFMEIGIKKGVAMRDFFPHKKICPYCGNEVTLKLGDE